MDSVRPGLIPKDVRRSCDTSINDRLSYQRVKDIMNPKTRLQKKRLADMNAV